MLIPQQITRPSAILPHNTDFSFDNITHYLYPNLLHNLCGYAETSETYIIKKYHGCKKGNRNDTRKITDYVRVDKCSKATNNPYWRETKDKYRYKGRLYLTRKTVRELRQLKISVMYFN